MEQIQDLLLLPHAWDDFSSQKLEEIAFSSQFLDIKHNLACKKARDERGDHIISYVQQAHNSMVSLIISVKYTCQIKTYNNKIEVHEFSR